MHTGLAVPKEPPPQCLPDVAGGLRRRPNGSATGVGAVVQGGQQARDVGNSWLSRNKWRIVVGTLFAYVLLARMVGDGAVSSSD